MKGIFITFEGPDGSGKSTQVKLFSEYLKNKGYDFIFTREPGGTPISEVIRKIILDPENKEMHARTEALLYAASRAQHVEEVVKPAIAAGKIVVCDRFMDSSIAYQGFGRKLGDGVRIINEFAVGGLSPDITFFMDLNPELGIRRVENLGSKDRLEQEAMDFHKAVYAGYKELSEMYKDRYINIDASRSIEEISKEIQDKFEEYVLRRTK